MRKTILLCTMLALFTGFAAADRATLDNTKTQTVLPLDTPPVIDGVIDLAGGESWQRATGARQGGTDSYWRMVWDENLDDYIRGGSYEGSGPIDPTDFGAQIYVGYDANYLYVAVRVTDDVLYDDTAAAGSQNGNTWEDDSVEVFVDGDNSNFGSRDTTGTNPDVVNTGGQYVITVNNAYREAEAGNPGYGEDKAWFAKTEWTDTGYDAEFRISMKTIGNPQEGAIIGFTIAINDDDDGGTLENQYIWIGSTHVEATYGNLLFGRRFYTAPKTAAPKLDGVISAGEYGNAPNVPINPYTGVYAVDAGSDEWLPEDHSFSFMATHDADAIYVAVDCTDDLIVTDSAAAGSEDGSTWEDDSVEIFFDSDLDRNSGAGTVGFEGQYVYTPIGAWRDNEALNPTFGTDWEAAASKTSKGYQIEFKVNKSAIVAPADGTPMGFNVCQNDDDGANRKSQLNWNGYPHNELSYGVITLSAGADIGEWSLY
ncbi:MAG: sugar-binding protein [Candidatus Omnitrophota bacterium]